MVLLIVQPGTAAQNEYCYAATRDTSVDVISRDLARLWNLQQRIRRLAAAMKAMSNHGWTRPLNMQGLTLDQVREYNMGHILGPVEDLFAKRCGNPPCAEAQATLVRTADEALETFSPNKTKRREPLDEKHMLRAIELCGGAVTIAYPMGIPEYDEVAHCLKDTEELAGTADSKTVLDEETCVVWFAGKMMAREQTLGKFVSAENATCKGAPQREVDTESRQKMMQMWHKKQQEEKELADDDDNNYLNSSWANPGQYRAQMHGIGNVRFR